MFFSHWKRAKRNVAASATGTRSDLLAFSGSSKSELRKTQRSLAENNSESGRAHGVDCGCAAASQSQSLLGSRGSARARVCVCESFLVLLLLQPRRCLSAATAAAAAAAAALAINR